MKLKSQTYKHLLRLNNDLESEDKDLQAQIKTLRKQQEQIKKKKFHNSKKLNSTETIISEHALVRGAERLRGVNLESLQNEILDDRIKEFIKTMGPNGTYPSIDDKFSVLVKNNIVVTVLTADRQ